MNRKFFTAPLMLKGETDDYFEVGGIASTEDLDLQAEIVKQQGLDLSLLTQKKIVFNDDHSKETKDIIGIVEDAKITDKGLKIKGKLFKNNPSAMTYYNLLKHGGYVGYSVEGHVLKRDRLNPKVVNNAVVTAVALTRNPINTKTYATFIKSLSGDSEIEEEFELTLEEKVNKALELLTTLVKGGPGSGKKRTSAEIDLEDEEGMTSASEKTKEKEKEIVVSTKQGDGEGDDAPVKEKRDKSQQKREEMKQEIKQAHENLKGSELREEIAIIKRKYFGDKERKRQEEKKQVTPTIGQTEKVKKSYSLGEIKAELLRRASTNLEFAKALKKALETGGPAYSTSLVGDFTQGQVFQQEGRSESETKKKKKKDKIKKVNDHGLVL